MEEEKKQQIFKRLQNDKAFINEEYETFLRKVEEVQSILDGLKSEDPKEVELASQRADTYLNGMKKDENRILKEELLRDMSNRTVINKQAFENWNKKHDPDTMNPEEFMKFMEKDAKERAEDRKRRQNIADSHKIQGNEAFRKGNFEIALNFYNKAMDHIKDSCVLYTNRALTYIKLGLYNKALEECKAALRVNEMSLKAKIYEAQAYYYLSKFEESDQALKEAAESHPNQKYFLLGLKEQWACQNQQDDECK